MKKFLKGPAKYPIGVSIVAILLFLLGYFLVKGLNIPVLFPSGTVANTESQLIVFTVMVSAIVMVPVFILLAVFAWRYREGNHKATYQPEWDNNSTLEIIWWSIPIIIICILGFLAWKTAHSLDPYRPIESDKPTLEIEVVALQWKWLFIYPQQGIATVNQLTVPVNRPVKFSTTAEAPMSAFWIPALGSQIYTMEGMNSTLHMMATKRGNYTGYNTNINGEGYSDMSFPVNVTSDAGFNDWVDKIDTKNNLDMSTYKQLAKPGKSDVKFYHLADDKLFDQIIAQYMQSQPVPSNNDVNTKIAGDK